MEALSQINKVLNNFGSSCNILLFYGSWLEGMLLMLRLNKESRQYWIEWENEYKQALDWNRYQIEISNFHNRLVKELLNHSLYSFLELIIYVESKEEFKYYLKFLEELECWEKLKINCFVSFQVLEYEEDKDFYLNYQGLMVKNSKTIRSEFPYSGKMIKNILENNPSEMRFIDSTPIENLLIADIPKECIVQRWYLHLCPKQIFINL